MHDHPRQQEQHEQHCERIEEAGLAEHVEGEHAEDRLDVDPLQAVGAAGDVGEALRQRFHQQCDAERDHQPRQVGAADHKEAGGEAEHRGGQAGHDQRQHRLIDEAVHRQQAGAIGADAEEGGVAQRDNAGIAEDQVERQREQRQPQDLGHDQIARRECQSDRQHDDPEGELAPVPAAVLPGMKTDLGLCVRGHAILTASPCDRTGRSGARSGSRS